jgi:putative transposase
MDEYENLTTNGGSASTKFFLYPNAAERCCTCNYPGIWARCSGNWPRRKESRIEEGHLLSDHVPMMMSIPPKYSVSSGC